MGPYEFGPNAPSLHLVRRLQEDPDAMVRDLRDELRNRWPELGLDDLSLRQFHAQWALPAKKAVHGEWEMPDFEDEPESEDEQMELAV